MIHATGICYIVGAMSLTPALRPYPTAEDYVIAADRGYDSLMAYGVVPDLAVGDFDSLGYQPDHPNVIQLPVEKDDTDMVYALRKGLELGYRRFVLLGGVGGRLEHTLANLQLLDWLTGQGGQGFLAGEKTVATAIRGPASLTFPAAMSGYLSAFCNSGTATPSSPCPSISRGPGSSWSWDWPGAKSSMTSGSPPPGGTPSGRWTGP